MPATVRTDSATASERIPSSEGAEESAWAARRAAVAVAAATLEARDRSTGRHSDDVALLCEAVAERLGMDEESIAHLLAAARLHDVGKVAVPEDILGKAGALDATEWEVIRRHTVTGEGIISSVPELRIVASIVRSSHERYDGTGYPDGLAGDQIPLASRIVFCANAFHAIRSDRPYRRSQPAAVALAELKRLAGSQFDPVVVQALADVAQEMRVARDTGALDDAEADGGQADGNGAARVLSLRSRRLAALLLALSLSGGALAATDNLPVVSGDEFEPQPAEAEPSGPADGDSRRDRGGATPRAGAKGAAAAGTPRRRGGRFSRRRARARAALPATPAQPGTPGGGATPAIPAQPARGKAHAYGKEKGKARGKALGHAKPPRATPPEPKSDAKAPSSKARGPRPKPKVQLPPAAGQPPKIRGELPGLPGALKRQKPADDK